ncbi:MAG TPA: hypothetical protein VK911_17425 [Vicinamibacterales bacterium]|nr:hypothetical protein [Vicinamibacterales bacterium]
MEVDTTGWSGDGDFTLRLLETLQRFDEIAGVRVEDAPAAGSGANYHFLANEVYVTFATAARRVRRWRYLPVGRTDLEPRLTLAGLEARLAALEEIGAPDYSDAGMLQYLRTERIVQPYQSRGYKLVELVRVYEAGRSIHPLA